MIYFVVPAFNEEANVANLIRRTHAFCAGEELPYHLIFVDDGSSDRTAEIAGREFLKSPGTLVSYRPNRGVHEAFRQGFHQALSMAQDGDVIVTMEADLTGDLGLLKKFLAKPASPPRLVAILNRSLYTGSSR